MFEPLCSMRFDHTSHIRLQSNKDLQVVLPLPLHQPLTLPAFAIYFSCLGFLCCLLTCFLSPKEESTLTPSYHRIQAFFSHIPNPNSADEPLGRFE